MQLKKKTASGTEKVYWSVIAVLHVMKFRFNGRTVNIHWTWI